MSDRAPLHMWTVYDHPRDMPDKFVARLWRVDGDGAVATDSVIITETLEQMHAILLAEMGLTRLARDPNDDPVIAEVWL